MTEPCPDCGAAGGGRYSQDGLVVCWPCFQKRTESTAANGNGARAVVDATIVTLEQFAGVEEEGAAAIVGEPGSVLIPEGGDVMLYGDGGAGKTTLAIDLACHLGAGAVWLGISIARPVRVLIIENEGPRPLLRVKLRRKLETWSGSPLGGRISVFEEPWGRFSFAPVEWRAKLAQIVKEHEIDVIIAGPLTRIGMNAAGTLQEVNEFAALVADVRGLCERRLTVILVHHENKGGAVSGAWEGACDTLLHVQAAGNGHTVVHVQKARWDSQRHSATLKLAWTEGEGFELEGDRNYLAEIVGLFSADAKWRTVKEIAAPKEKGGIGASEDAIRELLDGNPDRFERRTGDAAKETGRLRRAIVWQLRQGSNAVNAVGASVGGAEETTASASALKDADVDNAPPSLAGLTASDPQRSPTQSVDEEQLVAAFKDELDATEIGEDQWADYELEHDVETWNFRS